MENTKELTTVSPTTLLQLAIQKGVDVVQLEKLMDLQERWNKQQANKKFLIAKSSFQGDCPELKKSKKVDFPSKSGGGNIKYSYTPLGSITEQIKKFLQKNGLSYRWELNDTSEEIKCTCVVSHIDGHSEQTSLSAKKDATGSKNEIQMRGSTVTYLQRYTLIAALGISTADEDKDGAGTKLAEINNVELPQQVKDDILLMTTVKELDKYLIEHCKPFQKLVSFRELVVPLRRKMFAKEFPNKKYSTQLP